MKPVCKTYVLFLYPEIILGKTLVVEVETREISKLKRPSGAYGFKFFDILSVVIYVDGKPMESKSEEINMSPNYYYRGNVYTVEEIRRNFPKKKTLIGYMVNNNVDRVINCDSGSWHPFEKADILIQAA